MLRILHLFVCLGVFFTLKCIREELFTGVLTLFCGRCYLGDQTRPGAFQESAPSAEQRARGGAKKWGKGEGVEAMVGEVVFWVCQAHQLSAQKNEKHTFK